MASTDFYVSLTEETLHNWKRKELYEVSRNSQTTAIQHLSIVSNIKRIRFLC